MRAGSHTEQDTEHGLHGIVPVHEAIIEVALEGQALVCGAVQGLTRLADRSPERLAAFGASFSMHQESQFHFQIPPENSDKKISKSEHGKHDRGALDLHIPGADGAPALGGWPVGSWLVGVPAT
jgi:hypothetical protein